MTLSRPYKRHTNSSLREKKKINVVSLVGRQIHGESSRREGGSP